MRKYVFDRVHHTFDVLHDVAVRPAEVNKALILKVAMLTLIVGDLAFEGVRPAVDLDDDPLREAAKIDNKAIDWSLPAERRSDCLQLSQLMPKLAFSCRR